MLRLWTQEQFENGIKLINDGKTFKYISNILNKSYSSVKNYYNRRGYYSLIKPEYIICLNCNGEFKKNELKDGIKIAERTKFCSKSCSTIYSNKNGNRKRKYRPKCLNCENKVSGGEFYCSYKCMTLYKNNILINKIKNNDTSLLSAKMIKKGLLLIHGDKCMKCGWNEINEKSGKVPIEMNHKDGNSENNDLKNVELLCPNCHSLTPNYKALNYGNGREKRKQRARDRKSY